MYDARLLDTAHFVIKREKKWQRMIAVFYELFYIVLYITSNICFIRNNKKQYYHTIMFEYAAVQHLNIISPFMLLPAILIRWRDRTTCSAQGVVTRWIQTTG